MRVTDVNHARLPNPLASHALASPTPAPAVISTGEPQASPGTAPAARPSSATMSSARPSLVRARSDFGPRHPAPSPPESTDEASIDGHFKIRHGWDDQLNSEEYSNMLTSVRCALQPPGCPRD